MGTKLSKDEITENVEDRKIVVIENNKKEVKSIQSIPTKAVPNFDKNTSFRGKLRKSCRNWAVQK